MLRIRRPRKDATIHRQMMAAEIDGEFVVFLVGMRINKLWKIHKWLPIVLAMPKMLTELYRHPDSGFLGHSYAMPGMTVQYWRSFEDLEAWANSKDQTHWPTRVWFNKFVRTSSGDVGVWHETYLIKPGQYETLYAAMPAHGLGSAGILVPGIRRALTARERIKNIGEMYGARDPVEEVQSHQTPRV